MNKIGQKGITLVALVITIVVLLILAGISLNLVLGQNGIVTKAKEAKTSTTDAQVQEAVTLKVAEAYMEVLSSSANNSALSIMDQLNADGIINGDGEVNVATLGIDSSSVTGTYKIVGNSTSLTLAARELVKVASLSSFKLATYDASSSDSTLYLVHLDGNTVLGSWVLTTIATATATH